MFQVQIMLETNIVLIVAYVCLLEAADGLQTVTDTFYVFLKPSLL